MKVKAKFENIRDKIDGNEVDLSLCNLTEVPVRELAAFPKATSLDLSCNNLITLAPEFCSLVHLTRIDLSKNQLYSLPEDIGQLTSLQHLDLFQNKLITLPVSFSQLRLRWLDLKDNPLEAPLAKVAGDCLDDKQCRQCANMVLQHMRVLQEEADKLTEKRLLRQRELELKREAKQREQEAREKEVRKKEKAEEKERKRREYEAQQAALAQQETQRKRREERKERRAAASAEKKKAESAVAVRSGWSVWRLLLRLFLLLLLGACVSVGVCHVTTLRDEPVCVPLRTLLQDAVQWAEGQELLQPIMQKISPGHAHSS